MSNAENPIPPLPDAKTFLEGKDGIKPLQHKADALTQFAAGFEEAPLSPKAAETVVQLGDVMKKPHWAGAHDAAHDAISTARKLVTENPRRICRNFPTWWRASVMRVRPMWTR